MKKASKKSGGKNAHELAAVAGLLRKWDMGKREGLAESKSISLAPQVFGLVRTGTTPRQLAEKLGTIRTEQIGVAADPPKDLRTAVRIVSWWRRTR